MSKLRNVDAVRQMLDGTHKTQTKRSFNFDVKDVPVRRKVGERWVDENGNEWEQKEGYRIKHGKLDGLRAELFYKNKSCPKCGEPMTKRLDEKFYNLRKMCFDCHIADEHEMRVAGTFDEFERDVMRKNFEAWLKDAEKEKEKLKNSLDVEYVNQNGSIEKWDSPYTAEEIDIIFDKFKRNMAKKFGIELDG